MLHDQDAKHMAYLYTFWGRFKKSRREHRIRVIEIIVTLLEQCRPSYKLPCSTKFDVPPDRKNCINLPYIYKCLALYLRVFDVASNKFEFINANTDFSNFKERERAREKDRERRNKKCERERTRKCENEWDV